MNRLPPIPPRIILLCIVSMIFSQTVFAQRQPNSPVFRNYRPPESPRLQGTTSLEEDWSDFMLMKEANGGNASAQNTLGLRYLFGQGFAADTMKAVHWIGKAAAQEFSTAVFNYGLLNFHGTGVEWNPFSAFTFFQRASKTHSADALYMLGLMYTDNLIVQRNWKTAYTYLDAARRIGHASAREVIDEMFALKLLSAADTSARSEETVLTVSSARVKKKTTRELVKKKTVQKQMQSAGSWAPIFLDFNADSAAFRFDSVALVKNFLLESPLASDDSLLLLSTVSSGNALPDSLIESIRRCADAGNPNALMLLGFIREQQSRDDKSLIDACELYLLAASHEARDGVRYAYRIAQSASLTDSLLKFALQADPSARYVCAQLNMLGLHHSISMKQSIDLLEQACKSGHVASLLHLGEMYFNGILVARDRIRALDYWQRASEAGSEEATSRIAIASLMSKRKTQSVTGELDVLRAAVIKGSLLAKKALAYCFESGIGVKRRPAEAARLYRSAAQTGSESAVRELRRLYDSLRPNEELFQIQSTQ